MDTFSLERSISKSAGAEITVQSWWFPMQTATMAAQATWARLVVARESAVA
jgi:hypothetical protein